MESAGEDEVTGELINGGGCVIWPLNGVVPENWRSVVIVLQYTGKGERTAFRNYIGISLLSVVGKIYSGS